MSPVLKILLLDGDPEERESTARAMKASIPHVEIREILDADELAESLRTAEFSLAVTENQMGWTNGLAVLRAIKSRRPDCPVIMYTGSGDEEIAVEAMKNGLDEYLVKSSLNLEQLPRLVARVHQKSWYRQALRESEGRFRKLFDTIPVGLYRISLTGLILDANPAMVRILAYPNRESLLMVNANDLFVDPEERRQLHMQMECEGEIRSCRVRLRRKDGDVTWVENNAAAVKDDSGEILYYEGSFIDISERVRVEEALKEREHFLSNVFASIQDGISILDTAMNVVWVNPTMERWYAHEMPIVGKKCYQVYHGRNKPCDVCPTIVTLETGKPASERVDKVGAEGRKTGRLDLSSFPLVDTVSGRMEGVIEYVRDISRREGEEFGHSRQDADQEK